jgi:CMP-N-acetylneuraminic acid synthetase
MSIKQTKKYLALILARKNSKRLKNKNLKKLGNKSLIDITLDNLIKIRYLFYDIVVSSDSDLIKNRTEKKSITFIKRSKIFSLSKTSSEDSAIHAIKKYEKLFSSVDYIILFQVTSPFRKNSTIKKIINMSKKYPNDQIVSVSSKITKKPNGVIYLTPKKKLFKTKNFSYKGFRMFLIKSKKESLDIDTLKDLNLAKKMIKKNN